jgi:hypothetical protein
MRDLDTAVLEHEDLGLDDLYRQVLVRRAHDAEHVLQSWPSEVAAAQGAECLTDAIAHLHHAAARLSPEHSQQQEQLNRLAHQLLSVAAALELSADRLATAPD